MPVDRIHSLSLADTESVTSKQMMTKPEQRKKLKNVTWVRGQKPCKTIRQAITFAGRHTTHFGKPL